MEHGSAANDAELRHRIVQMERELAGAATSETLRDSRDATLAILRQRLRNLQRRDESLGETTESTDASRQLEN